MLFNRMLWTYGGLYTLYVLIVKTTAHPVIFCLSFLVYAVSLSARLPRAATPWVQLALLIVMQTAGHYYNSALPLYLLTLAKYVYVEESRARIWQMSIVYALAGLAVSIAPIAHKYSLLALLFFIVGIAFHFVIAAYLGRLSHITAKRTDRLQQESNRLSTQDALTGLCNYDECHKRLEQLIAQQRPFTLILIDCNEWKAIASSRGFQAGSAPLKQAAELLNILFSEALFLSRYGGDEFAVVLPLIDRETAISAVRPRLDSEFPRLTGIQITYAFAMYPYDSTNKNDLALLAEHHLFLRKRELWLKREEQLLQSEKLRVVGELASGMAHEIRNPLTTIKGFMQIARANGYNIEHWYGLIMSEIDRMSELTGEFLQFSKPQSARYQVLPLQACILKAVSLTESEAVRLGHLVGSELPEEPLYVLMDPDKIVQLLLNLIKNACEAIAHNGQIDIRLHRRDHLAELIVQDNGSGMSSDMLEQIFNPFYTTKETGTGLGLAICHKIVQDHHGSMEVESAVNNGTRFILTFPLSPAPALEHEQAAYG
ncbi:diguanylate cyclase [Paenibacillus athensensis]|uniref:ATP-binding protein n=1 Tax=Paenibacillus athensensis TaxID=1967502 RepID=UPI00142F50FC|nr:ATP-binding protein [Paenibacillus athensensis]MCD1257981.1 diguanylate cyclase [Paenibacillus athensensis]